MYNHNKAQQSKTVCIFLGIYCTFVRHHAVRLKQPISSKLVCEIYHLLHISISWKQLWRTFECLLAGSSTRDTKPIVKVIVRHKNGSALLTFNLLRDTRGVLAHLLERCNKLRQEGGLCHIGTCTFYNRAILNIQFCPPYEYTSLCPTHVCTSIWI